MTMIMIIEVMVKLYQIKMQMMIVAINKCPIVVFFGVGYYSTRTTGDCAQSEALTPQVGGLKN